MLTLLVKGATGLTKFELISHSCNNECRRHTSREALLHAVIHVPHPMAPLFLTKEARGCPRCCLVPSQPKWEEHRGPQVVGFYGSGLEGAHITSSHISMARTQSDGHSWSARQVGKYSLSLCSWRVNGIGDPPYPGAPYGTMFVFIGLSPPEITSHIYLLAFSLSSHTRG